MYEGNFPALSTSMGEIIQQYLQYGIIFSRKVYYSKGTFFYIMVIRVWGNFSHYPRVWENFLAFCTSMPDFSSILYEYAGHFPAFCTSMPDIFQHFLRRVCRTFSSIFYEYAGQFPAFFMSMPDIFQHFVRVCRTFSSTFYKSRTFFLWILWESSRQSKILSWQF